MSIDEIQNEIVEEFSMFDDWMDKYEYIIDLGKKNEPLAEEFKIKQNLIEGCQSKVWLHTEINEAQQIVFKSDSDAIITKGLAALIIRVFNEKSPDEILNANIFFVDKIGLSSNLSPTRSNGLASMLKQIKLYALAYKTRLSQ